ncbi:MAG: hypothetical protein ACLQDI_05285, partial [Syntrophobacteraceae bacterium]
RWASADAIDQDILVAPFRYGRGSLRGELDDQRGACRVEKIGVKPLWLIHVNALNLFRIPGRVREIVWGNNSRRKSKGVTFIT